MVIEYPTPPQICSVDMPFDFESIEYITPSSCIRAASHFLWMSVRI